MSPNGHRATSSCSPRSTSAWARSSCVALARRRRTRLFAEARALKPDYWPGYSHWADFLMRSGQKAEAKQLVRSGLEHNPDAKTLREQYRLLGGNPSEIVSRVKEGKLTDPIDDGESLMLFEESEPEAGNRRCFAHRGAVTQ
jgi:hypothetical protein